MRQQEIRWPGVRNVHRPAIHAGLDLERNRNVLLLDVLVGLVLLMCTYLSILV